MEYDQPMTEEEKTRLLLMENDVSLIKQRVEEISMALLGSSLTKDGGLVRRIVELELKADQLEEKMEEQSKKTSAMEIYQKIMWSCAGGAAVLLAKFAFELIFKK